MSKMDGLRAMREARYRDAAARTPETSKRAAPKSQPVATSPDAPTPAADQELADSTLCGHRAISGRTCTRERGHTSKSHRYS